MQSFTYSHSHILDKNRRLLVDFNSQLVDALHIKSLRMRVAFGKTRKQYLYTRKLITIKSENQGQNFVNVAIQKYLASRAVR